MSNLIKPWEMGEESNSLKIPNLVVGNFVLAKLGPSKKTGDIRQGLVATFVMTSYFDENDKKIELVIARESAEGYSIEFPLGKRGLTGTKFRGPNNQNKFFNPLKNKWMTIPRSKFTIEAAEQVLSSAISDWTTLSDVEKASYIDDYFEELYMFGISRDLLLPIEGEDNFTAPFVGMRTKLYRIYTPAKEGEKYPNIILSKWAEGKPTLDGEYTNIDSALATTIYDQATAKAENNFDPSTFTESNDEPF